jgi:uncharacterized protein
MSSGLLALLDDVAAIAKASAATLDDVAAQASRASVKAAGVVIDDAAVTPRYVVGLDPKRELPIIWRIARGSLRNKLLILLPVALALSALLPQAIVPLLTLGGAYLCFEGAEKALHAILPHEHAHAEAEPQDAAALEEQKVAGAIRTDLILSAEIMAITLASVEAADFLTRATVLAVVGIGITIGVYGVVALIVKADDAGVALARGSQPALRPLGRGLVLGMPYLLRVISVIGTAAMLWVGGGIVLHGLEVFGLEAPAHLVHDLAHQAGALAPSAEALLAWLAGAAMAGLFGLALGALIIALVGAAGALVRRQGAARGA